MIYIIYIYIHFIHTYSYIGLETIRFLFNPRALVLIGVCKLLDI